MFFSCKIMKRFYCCLVTSTLAKQTWAATDRGSANVWPGGRPMQPSSATASRMMAFSSATTFSSRHRLTVTNKTPQRQFQLIHMTDNDYLGDDVLDEEECIADDCLLTPQIYAASDDAEHKVEDTITTKALSAFASTDFEHEPHLSPELENAEMAYEVALMADAAHAFADAAEKESKQSLDAMLEREKEMQWIQNHEDDDAPYFLTPKASVAEMNQRALLEARLEMDRKAKIAKAREDAILREKNQRALLAARLMMEQKRKEEAETPNESVLRSEWMESEALAASMGGYEHTVGLASAAAASSAQVLSDTKTEEATPVEVEDTHHHSTLATAAEKMILGEDIALDIALIEDAEAHDIKNDKEVVEPTERKRTISEVNKWRQDYVQEIRSYMQKKGIVQSNSKLLRREGAEETVSDTPEKTGTSFASFKSDSAVKRALEHGMIRRIQQRRRLIVTALVMVLTRRLVLAWWGNALRLI